MDNSYCLGKLPFIQQVPLELEWSCGPDMPFAKTDYIQSVVVQGTVYVGGGYSRDDNCVVMAYGITSKKWTKLQPYKTRNFAMTAINNQLVSVGGMDHCGDSKVLGVWRADNKQWTHPYPSARSDCSAVVYSKWLVVAGGEADRHALSTVEVMNTDTKQWYDGPPTPKPWHRMKTATVGKVCYFMGGCCPIYKGTNMVYSMSLDALTTELDSNNASAEIWREMSRLQTTCSTPLSFSGSLLAVGGRDTDDEAVTAIHRYLPGTDTGTGQWVRVGDLPVPRFKCTCAIITSEMVVVGGYDNNSSFDRMDIATVSVRE